MALPLSSAEVAHLETAQRIFLSSLAYDATERWWAAATAAVRTLFPGEYVYSYLDCPGEPSLYAERLDAPDSPGTLESDSPIALASALSGGATAFGARERSVLLAMPVAASLPPLPPTHRPQARPRPGVSLTVYHNHSGGSSRNLVLSSIGLYHPPSRSPGTVEHLSDILRLLHPAFDSGVRAAVRLHVARHALAAALDAVGEAVFLAGPLGEPFHVSPALTALLEADPDRETVRQRLRELAERVVRLAWARPISSLTSAEDPPLPRGWQIVEHFSTAAAAYRARAVSLDEALLGQQAVVVNVEHLRTSPALRTTGLPVREADLCEAFGLTPQEGRVALLLASRKRNAEIADALCVSLHTARHHTEHVLEKLGVHSRDGVRDALEQFSSAKK